MSSAQNTPTPTSRPHSSAPTTVATRLPSTDSAPTELTNPSAPTALATRLVSTLTSIPASPNPELAIGSTMVSEKDGMVLIYVPAGDFEMGSSAQDAFSICASIYNICQNLSFKDLEPKHNVQLHSFWIDKTEVTNEMYKKCVDAGVCRVPPEFDNDAYAGNDHFPTQYDASEYAKFPVVRIAWQDASDYCGWAEKRLPTEAEWEKASRGPNGNIYPWGNNLSGSNLYFEKQLGTLSPVGQFPNGASFYEVLDLAGNVFEWVADWYDSAYYSASPIDNPQGPITGREKSIRGGYRDIFATIAPSMMRTSADSNFVSNHVGFRCVKDATS